MGENTQEFSGVPRINIRVESLSDLVFGLALSIGSLELLANTPKTPADLGTKVGLFAFSFLIVIAIWLGYSRIMTVMPQGTGRTLSLNLLLLFCVVLEPYLFFVMQSSPDSSFLDWASFGYALDVGAMFLILAGLIQIILKRIDRKELRLHSVLLERFRLAMYLYIFVGGTYMVSALPIFWIDTPIGPPRFALWYSAFAFTFLGVFNRRRERSQQSKKLSPLRANSVITK